MNKPLNVGNTPRALATLKLTVLLSAFGIASVSYGQSTPPLPQNADQVVIAKPPPPPKVVKPKQGTGNFAVHCPECGEMEVLKALTVVTNGGRADSAGMIVELTVTAKCPKTKKKFVMSAERTYPVRPRAVEVDAKPDKK